MRTESRLPTKIFFDAYGAAMSWQTDRIKAARLIAGRSAQQVADDLGRGIATYKKIESGARRATDGELWQIARYMGVDVAYFLRPELLPFPPPEAAPEAPQEESNPSPSDIARNAVARAKQASSAARKRG